MFSCDACSARCCLMGSMLVSSCRCCVLESHVPPVLICSSVFCTVYSLFVFVSSAPYNSAPYFGGELLMAVHVLSSVFLDIPQCVVVRAFIMSHRSLCEIYCFSPCPCFFSNTYVFYTIRKGFDVN